MTSLMDTYLENTEIVQPNHANVYNTAHGGSVMKWMDETGAISAMRFSNETCVTARMERVDFHHPIEVGNAAIIEAYVYETGTTSIKVRVRVFSEGLRRGDHERKMTTESYFTYVAIDENKKPTPVPELEVETEEEKKLQEAALDGRPENG